MSVEEVQSALDIAAVLRKEMPRIGILSRQKRLIAYQQITARAEQLADGDNDLALSALILLADLSRSFQKASVFAAMNVHRMKTEEWSLAGREYAHLVADAEEYSPE
jgi:hypothetical protein